MHSLEAQWLGQTIISLVPCPELDSQEMLCAKPQQGHLRGSFHPGYKIFTCPSRLGSSLRMVQTGCLGLVQLRRDFGGGIAVSRGGKAGRARGGCRGGAGTRRGSEPSPRGRQTGRGHRPPASDVTSASPCVSRLPWHRRHRNHSRLPRQQHQLGHAVLSPSSQPGLPGDGGDALLPQRRMRVPPSPWDRDAILLPRSSDLCSSTTLTATFFFFFFLI